MPDVDPYSDEAPPEFAAVRFGEDLDWKSIEAYLRANLPADLAVEGEFEVLQFPNGAANLTYLIRFANGELPALGVDDAGLEDGHRSAGALRSVEEEVRAD